MLLFAPAAVAVPARLAGVSPVGVRLALRDLGRYRARSGAALAAIALATGISAAVVIGAGAAQAATEAPVGGNLPSDQLIVWLAPGGVQKTIPQLSATELANARSGASAIGAAVQARSVIPLEGGLSPSAPDMTASDAGANGKPVATLAIPRPAGGGRTEYRGNEMIPLLVATPALLARYGIDPAGVGPAADVLTSRASLDGYQPAHLVCQRRTVAHSARPDRGHGCCPGRTRGAARDRGGVCGPPGVVPP
jgi:putative ABC transport system permease protein